LTHRLLSRVLFCSFGFYSESVLSSVGIVHVAHKPRLLPYGNITYPPRLGLGTAQDPGKRPKLAVLTAGYVNEAVSVAGLVFQVNCPPDPQGGSYDMGSL
jgi:hypothetical protein